MINIDKLSVPDPLVPRKKTILDDDQQFAFMKFKRNVNDILTPRHTEGDLLRWIKARNWNPEAAEKMFRESMKWRKEWKVDDELKSWVPPEVLSKYVPSGCAGFSKEGCPVYIVPIKGLDIVGILMSIHKDDLIKFTINLLESVIDLARQNGVYDLIIIFDLEEFLLRPYAWRPATEVVIALLKMYEANYPEILKVCYITNTPKIFSIAFNVIKRFLHENTISKIKIYKVDSEKWKTEIRELVDENQLPQHYGGNKIDPDGDARCASLIVPGGKVPKSYYKKNGAQNPLNGDFVSATIKKGSKLALDYIVAEEGCFLKYEFRTEGHDIRFGITCKDEEGNIEDIIKLKRVASNDSEVNGVIQCNSPATYVVTFDNSYSLFKSKKIHYSVGVSEPISSIEVATSPTSNGSS